MARFALMIALAVFGATILGCEEEPPPKKTGGPYYYGTFDAKNFPDLVPINEISESEAKQRRTYYVAYFNDLGGLIRFEKYIDNAQLLDTYEYFYDGDGNLMGGQHIDTRSGRILPYELDSNGRLRPVAPIQPQSGEN